jgi:RNA polymerase sigma-70 factor (sigma-E family)
MNLDLPGPAAGWQADLSGAAADPDTAVTRLYREHALPLTRLALVMTGDRQAAEDIVQDAFCGLHRSWHRLRDAGKALPYVRAAVMNGCRSEFRRHQSRRRDRGSVEDYMPPAWSAESAVLASAERRAVLQALSRLPARQREALVLRFFLDLSEADIAATMQISRGTVKSTVARGLAALREQLGEES